MRDRCSIRLEADLEFLKPVTGAAAFGLVAGFLICLWVKPTTPGGYVLIVALSTAVFGMVGVIVTFFRQEKK